MANLQAMLKEFQAKFDLPKGEFQRDWLGERVGMLQEEIDEMWYAIGNQSREKALDALVDLVYFAIGTATALNWDFDEAFKRVHEANMKKVRAYTERSAVDLIKPNGWVAPDLSDLVKE